MAVSKAKVRKLALSFEGANEVVHVDRPAFRTTRKIFATLPPDEARREPDVRSGDARILPRTSARRDQAASRRVGPHGHVALQLESSRRSARPFCAQGGAYASFAQAEESEAEGLGRQIDFGNARRSANSVS